ncbi:glycosyltransferase [Butyrivibrio hungatei]|uniref:Glycosyl transferase GT4 family n=1 Tax=Butyrivibrio hungatei TaxID=185008 RepID=A0A1D9NZ51_9FIRM|nr:glycosyltransferase [Butyrivibrio hungatei]AOZ95499.1 glycosyl transferase GT4 family [Butyrivibrio hungatei]
MKNENKKNIALFVGKLTGGGAERAVGRLSIALSDYYNVFIFLYNLKAIDYDYKGTIVDLGNNASNFPMMAINSAIRLNKEIRDNNIDLLISFLDMPNILNGLFNHSCKKMISIRVYYEKGHFFTINDKLKYPLVKRAVEKSNGVFVLSERQKKIIARDMKVDINNVFVVDNIFDIDEIEKKAACEPENKKIADFINESTTVAVGRLDYQKNYKKLFEIFKKVNEKIPHAKLLVLGTGYMKEDLQNYIRQLNLDGKIMLAGRVVNPFPYLAKSTAYISLSRFEGFPNSLVEAMVCGLPVMQSDCPTGPSEILVGKLDDAGEDLPRKEEYGILLPMFEPGIYGDKSTEEAAQNKCMLFWCDILNNETVRSYYSEKSKMRSKKYDVKCCIGEYVEVIEHFLKE